MIEYFGRVTREAGKMIPRNAVDWTIAAITSASAAGGLLYGIGNGVATHDPGYFIFGAASTLILPLGLAIIREKNSNSGYRGE